MALETFKAQLKAYLKGKKVNLSQTRIDAIAAKLDKKNPDITEAADHDTAIADMDDLVGFVDIAKQDDKIRTLEAKSKTPPAGSQEDDDDDVDDEPAAGKPKDRTPAWAKALIEKVDRLEGDRRTTSIRQQITDKLKDKGVPEKYWDKWSLPESADKVDEFVTEIETGWTELKQESNNAGLAGSTPPASGSGKAGDAGKVDADLVSFAKKQNEKATA